MTRQVSYRGVLITDFDGTLTQVEFYQLVARAVDTSNFWNEYEKGRMSHFEAMAHFVKAAGTDLATVEALADQLDPDPRFGELVTQLEEIGWQTIVASAGCDWYIRRALRRFSVTVPIHTNIGQWVPGQGIVLSPHPDPRFRDADIGVSKAALVRDAMQRAPHVAFAGDGMGDVEAARLVVPRRRFARRDCAAELTRRGEAFQPFSRWAQVAEAILSDPEARK